MRDAAEGEIKRELGVVRGRATPANVAAAMASAGVDPGVAELLKESGALGALSALCESHSAPLAMALCHERYGAMFASSMRDQPNRHGAQARAAMLPEFERRKALGQESRRNIVRSFARAVAKFHWQSESEWIDRVPAWSAHPEREVAIELRRVLIALLDFMPKAAHEEIVSARDMFLLRAVGEGALAFEDEEERGARGSDRQAKSL